MTDTIDALAVLVADIHANGVTEERLRGIERTVGLLRYQFIQRLENQREAENRTQVEYHCLSPKCKSCSTSTPLYNILGSWICVDCLPPGLNVVGLHGDDYRKYKERTK